MFYYVSKNKREIMLNKEIKYILDSIELNKYIDLRKDYFFFSDLDELSKTYPALTTFISYLKKILGKFLSIILTSSVLLACFGQDIDTMVNWWVTAIITFLYFTMGYYYLLH